MGLFDLFKPKVAKSTVPENEKKHYQDDSYYTTKAFEGTQFEREVVTFEQRKKISFPSQRGLYVGEILLLEYVSYGKYPGPPNGYPGFWWFQYGIRDVGAKLKELESKGFIEFASSYDSVSSLKVDELKQILENNGIKATGKKADLIEQIRHSLTEEQVAQYIDSRKYKLTELGFSELKDNEYVPYMHKEKYKTTEDDRFGPTYNVWSINKILKGNTENWKSVVEAEYKKREAFLNRNN